LDDSKNGRQHRGSPADRTNCRPAQRHPGAAYRKADQLGSLFPEVTISEKRFTMALPVIWQDWPAFEAAARVNESAKVPHSGSSNWRRVATWRLSPSRWKRS
jgi:hypothetical protein